MSKKLNTFPTDDGFRMPGEFEKHEGCWMIWPERTDNWRQNAKPAQNAFSQVAKAISKYEKVTMCVSTNQYSNAKKMLPNNIRIIEMDSDDAWMRDVAPTFVINNEGVIRGIDWRFNAWGGLADGLYFPWDNDDKIARKVCEVENFDYYSLENFILEGGAIHTDGEGTLIVTEECLLHEGRNPDLTKNEIENILKNYLGVTKVLWIKNGIYLDETNGHVDNIIHYCAPTTIVLAWTDNKNDPQYEISKNAFEYLSNQTDAKGRKLTIHKLHIPDPILITEEESEGVERVAGTLPRLPGNRQAASYTNFYIANGAIILPLFNDIKYDNLATKTLQNIFPNYIIEGIYAREIILGGGNIHCITQQQPLGIGGCNE